MASDYLIFPGVKTFNVTNVTYEDASGNVNGDYITLSLKKGKKITLNIPGIQNDMMEIYSLRFVFLRVL